MSLPLLERRLLCPDQERRQGNQALSSDDGSPDCEPRARFKQEQREIDRSQGKLTLAELCDRYIKTVQHQTPKTVTQKTRIVANIKEHWPIGSLIQVAKIKPSEVDLWLARFRFRGIAKHSHSGRQRRV